MARGSKFTKKIRLKAHKRKTKSIGADDDDEELDYELVKYTTQKKSERRSIIIVITLLILFSIFLSSVIFVCPRDFIADVRVRSD